MTVISAIANESAGDPKRKMLNEKKIEDTMRVLANFIIDRFLEDKKNNRLKLILEKHNINLEQKNNHGTLQ